MICETPIDQDASPNNGTGPITTELVLCDVNNQEFESTYFYHRDPAYRPWLRAYLPDRPSKYQQYLALLTKHLHHAVLVSKCALVFAIVIALDILLPNRQRAAEIKSYHISITGTIQMVIDDGSVINISTKARQKIKGNSITLYRTLFFGVPFRMTDKENNTAHFEISIYGHFGFVPLALLLTSFLGSLRNKNIELRYAFGVVSLILVILNIVFFQIHHF